MNSAKSAVRPMNSNKNKLNSKIILTSHFNPNAHALFECYLSSI